jgi:hypothetical protein
MSPGLRVLLYDSGQGYLTTLWRGGSFLGGFDVVIGAKSWRRLLIELYTELERRKFEDPIAALQIWGHGRSGAPMIGDNPLIIDDMVDAVAGSLKATSYVWFRSCDVFSRAAGVAFAVEAVRALGCGVVGHTRVVSLPNPLCQSGGHGLLPGRHPQWSPNEGVAEDGRSLGSGFLVPNTCLVTAMDPPAAWWRS